MKDKKCCDNCIYVKACDEECKNYDHWKRDPAKWMDILPTEPGFYWFRIGGILKDYDICDLFQDDENQWMIRPLHSERAHKIEWLINPELQGPLTPKGER